MGALVSAHETLRQAGIRPEQIRLVMNDTKICPNSGPAGGSRSQVMTATPAVSPRRTFSPQCARRTEATAHTTR